MFRLITIVVTSAAIALGFIINHYLMRVPDLPEYDYKIWWGDGPTPHVEDQSIRPFKIEFSDTMIADLKSRLQNRRAFRRPLEGTQSEYGINTLYLDKVLNYWIENYDFKGRAERLNNFSHYKTRIQGLDIHYIRAAPEKRQGVKVLPLLLLHGWPSSSKEFDVIIPALTKPRNEYDFVFDVIAADLPGFGFSEGTNKPGLTPMQIGIIMRNLMKRLGFNKFYIQAGDWGSQTATHMCTLFPEDILGTVTETMLISDATTLAMGVRRLMGTQHKANKSIWRSPNLLQRVILMHVCIATFSVGEIMQLSKVNIARVNSGIGAVLPLHRYYNVVLTAFHTNMPHSLRKISFVKILLGSLFPSLLGDPQHLERIYPLTNFLKFVMKESGYFHLQATKPDTIGAALTDTPVGMAAYLMEKLGVGSNRDQLHTEHGGLGNLNIDDVLDTITIMWANEQITTSVRIYAEGYRLNTVHNIPTPVPTAAINFKYEVYYQPDWILRDKFPNLVRSTTLDIGGHFAAMHTPKELTDDIFASVREFIKFETKL